MADAATEIEFNLKATLTSCQQYSVEIQTLVADTLLKLMEDMVEVPYVVVKKFPDPEKTRAALNILAAVIAAAGPQQRLPSASAGRGQKFLRKACVKAHLGGRCTRAYTSLFEEIRLVFARLREVFSSGGKTPQAARELLHVIRKFFRLSIDPLLTYSFHSIHLQVCVDALVQCNKRADTGRQRIAAKAILVLVDGCPRFVAGLNARHLDTLSGALALAV